MSFSVGKSQRMHFSSAGECLLRISDPLRIYSLNYWTYIFTGFWKYKSTQQWKMNLYKIYQLVLALVYSLLVFSFFFDAISVRNDLDKLSFNMSSSVLIFVTVMKLTLLRSKNSNLESVLNNLDNNLNVKTVGNSKKDKEIFKKRAELILNMTKLLYGLLVVCYTLRVMADTAFDTRGYLIPMPFKEKLDDHYEVIYAQQMIIITHFLVTVIAHDLLIYGIINRLIAHYEVLEKNFLGIKNLYPKTDFENYVQGYIESDEEKDFANQILLGKNSLNEIMNSYKMYENNTVNEVERVEIKEKRIRQLLRENIFHHQKLLREVTSFSRIYSQPLLVQACGAVLLIGIVAVNILFLSNKITPLLIQQVMYVGITLINILYLCSFGSELTSKSLAAANALYDTPWYEMNVKNRKIVHFAMGKLNEGPKLRGGHLVVIDRVTYLKFLQTSYNMAVVLRNVY